MYIAMLPDADRGMPNRGVTPSHGRGARIGIGAPPAVAQLPALQRHAETGACTRKRVSPARATRCGMYTRGSAPGTSKAASESWPAAPASADTGTAPGPHRFSAGPHRSEPHSRSLTSGVEAHSLRPFVRADRAVHRERNRTMARTKRSRRSYGAGEWGRNGVRIFPDPKTGLFQIEWRENGRRLDRAAKAGKTGEWRESRARPPRQGLPSRSGHGCGRRGPARRDETRSPLDKTPRRGFGCSADMLSSREAGSRGLVANCGRAELGLESR